MPTKVNKWIIAITVMLPTMIVILDTSVVNVSLDHIRGSLSATIDPDDRLAKQILREKTISHFFSRLIYSQFTFLWFFLEHTEPCILQDSSGSCRWFPATHSSVHIT
jgi:hypothetical protein